MARTTQITREALVDAGVRLVLEKGLEALNARSLAAQAGCSIQPVFRNFGSMENLRAAVFRGLDAAYQSFIGARIYKRTICSRSASPTSRWRWRRKTCFRPCF